MNAVEIKKLTKTYKSGVQALNGVDINVKKGDFFALLGSNGAGKTTIIGIICSLVNKTSGLVKIFGVDIDKNIKKAKQSLGIVPQEFNFNIFEPVQQIVVNQAGYYGIPRAVALKRSEGVLKQLGLWDKRHTQSQQLSGGMKRRLMIARALIHEPKILILDEPTAGVDIELRRSMWDFLIELNKSGTTIILTTHYLEEAEQLCRNIAIVNHGQVVKQCGMKELLSLLDMETFVVQTHGPILDLKKINGYTLRSIDKFTLEIDIKKGQQLTQAVNLLCEQGIEITSMRTRANRLEEIFLHIIDEAKEKP